MGECYALPGFVKTYFDYKQFARDLLMYDYWFDYEFVLRVCITSGLNDHSGGTKTWPDKQISNEKEKYL